MVSSKVVVPTLLALMLASPALAQGVSSAIDGKSAGDFMVRVRALGVLPNTDGSISSAAIGGKPDISNEATPEIDFSYFVTDNIALELIAASPKHDVNWTSAAGSKLALGDVRLLPPCLTLQYHFMPKETFSPYVGAGVNYTWFYDRSGPHAAGITRVKVDDSMGAVLQAGFDYHLTGHWFANFDVKQVFLNTDVHLNGGGINANVDINPTIVGAGVGYRF